MSLYESVWVRDREDKKCGREKVRNRRQFLLLARDNGAQPCPAQGILLVDIVLVDGPVGDGVHFQVLRGGNASECQGRLVSAARFGDGGLPTRPGGAVAVVRGQRTVAGEVRDEAVCPAVLAVGDGCDFGAGV